MAVKRIFVKGLSVPLQVGFHPISQESNLLLRKLLLRGHVWVGLAEESLQQQTGLRLSRRSDHAAISSFEERLARTENQTALFLIRVVANHAFRFQQLHHLGSRFRRTFCTRKADPRERAKEEQET